MKLHPENPTPGIEPPKASPVTTEELLDLIGAVLDAVHTVTPNLLGRGHAWSSLQIAERKLQELKYRL